MSFMMTVLASACGFLLIDILLAVIKVAIGIWKDRLEAKARKIGFGDRESDVRAPKGTTMRKIGFGAND